MYCSLHKCASKVSRLSPWHRCHTVEAPFHTLPCAAPTRQELCSNRGAVSGGISSQLRAWLCVPWLTNTLFTSISGIFHTCPQTNTHLTRAEVRPTTHQRNLSVLLLWLFSLRSSSHFTWCVLWFGPFEWQCRSNYVLVGFLFGKYWYVSFSVLEHLVRRHF